MAEETPMLSPDVHRTVTVVGLILALLALVFSFYDYRLTMETAQGVIDITTAQQSVHDSEAQKLADIDQLKQRLDALEAKAAAMPAPAADGTADAAAPK